MLDVCVLCGGNQHKVNFQQSFIKGLEKHGLKYRVIGPDDVPDCDLVVFWGHKYSNIISNQSKKNKDYLVAELGYVGDRTKWTSLGYNGLNGRADFCVENVDGSRWQKYHKDKLQPIREDGKYYYVMGQMPGDASTKNINISNWAIYTYFSLKAVGIATVYRPHPRIKKLPKEWRNHGIKVRNGNLKKALSSAKAVITYNSNSGVDAVIAGIPTVTCDPGSMVYEITSHDPVNPKTRNRTKWSHRIAWCQWTFDEIAAGDAWEHLKQRYR